jgi:cyclopropane fatty-acyl-phospholipid synthase-like methyltransferase
MKDYMFDKEYFTNKNITYYAKFNMDSYMEVYKRLFGRIMTMLDYYRRIGLADGTIKILDLGSGLGYMTKALVDNDFDAYGIDISNYAKENVCYSLIKHKTIVGDIREIDKYFDDNFFDIIIGTHVLEYFTEPELNSIMSKLSVVCKNGARCLFTIFTDTDDKDINNKVGYIDKYRTKDKSVVFWRNYFSKTDNTNMEHVGHLVNGAEEIIFQISMHRVIGQEKKDLYLIEA